MSLSIAGIRPPVSLGSRLSRARPPFQEIILINRVAGRSSFTRSGRPRLLFFFFQRKPTKSQLPFPRPRTNQCRLFIHLAFIYDKVLQQVARLAIRINSHGIQRNNNSLFWFSSWIEKRAADSFLSFFRTG